MTAAAWTVDGGMHSQPGEAGGCHVASGAMRGYAKPAGRKPDGCPRAAHEKIASDLAYDLKLPVPPVVLWQRATTDPSEETCCCISAIPFDAPHKWGQIEAVPTTAARLAKAFSAQASAMSVFDAWVDNRDRLNAGNVVASEVAWRDLSRDSRPS